MASTLQKVLLICFQSPFRGNMFFPPPSLCTNITQTFFQQLAAPSQMFSQLFDTWAECHRCQVMHPRKWNKDNWNKVKCCSLSLFLTVLPHSVSRKSHGCCRRLNPWPLLISCLQKFAEKFPSTIRRGPGNYFGRVNIQPPLSLRWAWWLLWKSLVHRGLKLTIDHAQIGPPVKENCTKEVPGECVCLCDLMEFPISFFFSFLVHIESEMMSTACIPAVGIIKEESEFPWPFFNLFLVFFFGNHMQSVEMLRILNLKWGGDFEHTIILKPALHERCAKFPTLPCITVISLI